MMTSLSMVSVPYPSHASAELIVSAPYAVTVDGERIIRLGENAQGIIMVDLENIDAVSQPYVLILEIRDADDITIYLQFQKGELDAHSESQVGISWASEAAGSFQARALILSSLENPFVLSPVVSSKLDVSGSTLSVPVEEEEREISSVPQPTDDNTISELKRYALELINADRQAHSLPPVELSDNLAAQVHADDVFETKIISHWMSNGEKPYMTYTRYGGTGDVSQNVAVSGDVEYYDKCVLGEYLCARLDPSNEIKDHQYGMMYDDEECCDNGHRDNILDPNHTHVSIGITYDDYFLTYVQNFENNYVEYNKLESDKHGYVTMSGTMQRTNSAYILIYYDEYPTTSIYLRDRDLPSYGMGEHIAFVVEPLDAGYRYPPNPDYYIFEAQRWRIQNDSFTIEFSLDQVMEKKERGVYTIILMAGDEDKEFPVTSYSIFKD